MKMRSVAENEDDSQYWNSLVESEINEFKDGKNDHFAENVSKVESALLQFQNSYVNHDCHEKRDRKQSSLVNSKQHFRFDLKQIDILSEEFLKNPYPSTSRRQLIANQFHISEKTIMNWFVNKRYTLRKHVDIQKHTRLCNTTGNMFVFQFLMKKFGNVCKEKKKRTCNFNLTKNHSSMKSASFKPWRPWVTSKRE